MTRFKFLWDRHILYHLMTAEEHFHYMSNKWGDVWYSYMEENY
jgi:hypothetical protein